MKASGFEGELRVCYQRAARLRDWTLDITPGPTSFSRLAATISDEHGYWIRQTPMDVVVYLGRAEWLWRDVALQRSGERVTCTVTGPPIVSARRSDKEGE